MRALGHLSDVPALRALFFECCCVTMCESVVGAARHASFEVKFFNISKPAPWCAAMVLQVDQALKRLGRCGMKSR